MANMFETAVKGLDVVSRSGIVRVRDGHDTWLCRKPAWDAARAKLETAVASDDVDSSEAYTRLCRSVTDVASMNGTSRGDCATLVLEALKTNLIDEDDAKAFGAMP